MSWADAARVVGMDRQTLRDWAHRFNAEGPKGLRDRPHTGRPRQLSEARMRELAEITGTGPDPALDGVVRWRRVDLQQVIEDRFGVSYSERAIPDLLRALSFSYISGRPQHPRQDPQVFEGFKKILAHARCSHRPPAQGQADRDLVAGRGQAQPEKRPYAHLGQDRTRPRLTADQRCQNAYLFGAICPRRGTGAALMLPKANTMTMQLHIEEISKTVAAKAHAVVLMDRAGWHKTDKLKLPKNLTIVLPPSCAPELYPVENVWQHLRQN